MAGRGPAPKANRQRRGEPLRGEWVDLPPLERTVLPALPAGDWSQRTRDAWAAWSKDPVTAQYSDADIQASIDLAYVYEQWVKEPTIAIAAEIRQRQDRLGLNPKGKRDLRWRVKEPAEVVEMPAPKQQRRLRAVE